MKKEEEKMVSKKKKKVETKSNVKKEEKTKVIKSEKAKKDVKETKEKVVKTSEKKSVKKTNAKENKKSVNIFKGIGNWFKEEIEELKKVSWPTKKVVMKNFVATLLCVIFLGILFYLIDIIIVWLKTVVM